MTESKNTSEQKMVIIISYLLRIGVILAAIITLAGGVFYLWHEGRSTVAYGEYLGEPMMLRGIPDIASDALSGNFMAIIQIGILLLIATPIVRVAFSVLAFLLERDYLYFIITLIVLAILISGYISYD